MFELDNCNYGSGFGQIATEVLARSNQAQQMRPNISYLSRNTYQKPSQLSIRFL